MSWDDIDFDFIKSKYITRGSAEVSYGDILQQFARAGDERQNLIGENPTIAGLTFDFKDIRDDSFWTKYRALITQYKNIMFGIHSGSSMRAKYYERGVLADPVNFAQYEINFQIILGEDLFNKIDNNSQFSNTELFTAEVLNGFYTIYQNTEIIDTFNVRNTSAIRNIPTRIQQPIYYWESPKKTGGAGGVYADLLPLIWTPEVDLFTGNIASLRIRANLDATKWSVDGFNGADPIPNYHGIDIILDMRDQAGDKLTMDFIGLGRLRRNIKKDGLLLDEAFTNRYPKIDSNSGILVEWDSVTTTQEAAGTKKYISITGLGSPIQQQPLNNGAAAPNGRSEQQYIDLQINTHTFIDLNNSALEFFIA